MSKMLGDCKQCLYFETQVGWSWATCRIKKKDVKSFHNCSGFVRRNLDVMTTIKNDMMCQICKSFLVGVEFELTHENIMNGDKRVLVGSFRCECKNKRYLVSSTLTVEKVNR